MRIGLFGSVAVATLVAAILPGCGGGEGFRASLVPVKGKVTYKGKPLTKGTVTFEPDGEGRLATGELQADGTYELTTYQKGDGTVVGQHRVYIKGTGPNPRKELVPQKYTTRQASNLTADVDADHTEHIFDLK
jgi:hypothetical protein